jgi:hypothetical protein
VFSDRELEGFLDWYAVAYSEGLATHYDLMNEIIEEIKKNRKMDVNDYRWFLLWATGIALLKPSFLLILTLLMDIQDGNGEIAAVVGELSGAAPLLENARSAWAAQ